jgi:hypothetical protein
MDGDMELEEGFVDQAVAFCRLNQNMQALREPLKWMMPLTMNLSRKQRINKIYPLGDSDHLGGGGLYRRSAIEKVGYLTNRNLHAYEEAELGLRLIEAGYKLRRLDIPYLFIRHTRCRPFRCWRALEKRILSGSGELLRCVGENLFGKALKMVRNEAVFSFTLIGLFIAAVTFNLELFDIAFLPLLAFIVENRTESIVIKRPAKRNEPNRTFCRAG